MSGKVVGSFCSYLRYQRFVSSDKYLIGMMELQLGFRDGASYNHASSKYLSELHQVLPSWLNRGKLPGVSFLVTKSCKRVGGFGDGHSAAASGVIPAGREDMFLDEFETLAKT